MRVEDLSPVAFMYRAMAASVYNSDEDEYERLENQADKLYDKAAEYGLEFVRVPRLASKVAQTVCETCGVEFLPQRRTAKYCSQLCRQKYNYHRLPNSDAKGGKPPGHRVGKRRSGTTRPRAELASERGGL